MDNSFFQELSDTLAGQGFRPVPDASKNAPGVKLLLKRQTWNMNRAVVVASLPEPPEDFGTYLHQLRNCTAFRCGFAPFFWGLGIQAVIVAPGLRHAGIAPSRHVSRIDNQWAIVQSIFLIDSATATYTSTRTWGQLFSGKFQDAIEMVVARYFQKEENVCAA